MIAVSFLAICNAVSLPGARDVFLIVGHLFKSVCLLVGMSGLICLKLMVDA